MATEFIEKTIYHKNIFHIKTVETIAFSMKNSESWLNFLQ